MAQVTLRAERLGGAERRRDPGRDRSRDRVRDARGGAPGVCVIDSVQTLHAPELGSAPGSVAQVREAAGRLLRVAKEAGVATILVGHVTKDGAVAGPRVLEHLVDCVLQFEGDRYHAHRILRAVKNRFGSTNELGVFEMTGGRPRRRARPFRALRQVASGGDRRRRRLRARGHAPDPARGTGARRENRPRHAAPGRHGCRSEAARDDRRRALAPRRRAARQRGRVRERRRGRSRRRAGCRSCRGARDRVRRARRTCPRRTWRRSARSA